MDFHGKMRQGNVGGVNRSRHEWFNGVQDWRWTCENVLGQIAESKALLDVQLMVKGLENGTESRRGTELQTTMTPTKDETATNIKYKK